MLARHRGEGEALLGGDDHRAGNGGQRAGVLAVAVVGDQLVDLAADHRALVRGLALGDALLQHLPVHTRAARCSLGRGRHLGPCVTQHFELHQTVDVLGRKRSLEEFHSELLHPVRGNCDHEPVRLLGASVVEPRPNTKYCSRSLNPSQHVPILAIPVHPLRDHMWWWHENCPQYVGNLWKVGPRGRRPAAKWLTCKGLPRQAAEPTLGGGLRPLPNLPPKGC